MIPELGELGVLIVPAPESKLQVPVPFVGVLAAMVAVVAQTVWSLPAVASDRTVPQPNFAIAMLLFVAAVRVDVPKKAGPK